MKPSVRFVLSAVAIVLSIGFASWLLGRSDDQVDALKDGLRSDGLTIFALFAGGVVLGTLVHTAAALGRRPRPDVAAAWLGAGAVLGYGVLVGLVAWLLAGHAPEMSPDRHRSDPGALYPAWLVCVLLPAAVAVSCGTLFQPRPAAGRPVAGRETARRETAGRETAGRETAGRETAGRETVGRETVLMPVLISSMIGWVIGGLILLLLLGWIAFG